MIQARPDIMSVKFLLGDSPQSSMFIDSGLSPVIENLLHSEISILRSSVIENPLHSEDSFLRSHGIRKFILNVRITANEDVDQFPSTSLTQTCHFLSALAKALHENPLLP